MRLRSEDLPFLPATDAAALRRGHPFAYALSLISLAMLATGLVWAHHAILDEVAQGLGQVIPSSRIQVIQNLEGGLLSEVLVGEGASVEPGQVLVRIDNSQAGASFRDAASQLAAARAAVLRLEAELENHAPVFPPDVQADPALVEAQTALFHARRKQQDSQLAVLRTQAEQRRQEIAEMESRQRQLEANLKIAREQRDMVRPLAARGIYPQVEFLKLEREVQTLDGDLSTIRLSIPRAHTALREAAERVQAQGEDFIAQTTDELNKRRLEMQSLTESVAAGKDRVVRTEVRSPVRGTVKQIYANTLGGVIKPGENIMEVVPRDDTLLVEARVRPADIAFLRPDQPAMVKLTAYDFSIYGGLPARIEQISADTIKDEKGDSFYLVKVRTNDNALVYNGERLPIIPGMTAAVDVLTGKKSVLDYLLKPLRKAREHALRER